MSDSVTIERPPRDPLKQALQHTTTAVPVVEPSETIAHVRALLGSRRFDSVRDVAVCDGARLVGLLRIEDVLAGPGATPVRALMDRDPPTVAPGTDQEIAAWKAARHGESSLAVIDDAGRFSGLIPPHRLLTVLLAEHDEDMARLGGSLGTADPARSVSYESVRRRLQHRLPWLLLGLVGATGVARLVGAFEGLLAAHVTVAFFVPAVVYMAAAVGTQTETLVIRGLSLGVPLRSVAAREVITGTLIGVVLAVLFIPVGLVLGYSPRIVVAVAGALFAASTSATAVAMALPWVLSRARLDPAFGSGPLATVVQDLLSVAIYLGLVTVVLV